MAATFDKLFFKLRFDIIGNICSGLLKAKYRIQGMKIGAGTYMNPLYLTWPHQVQIGSKCLFEKGVDLKFDGIWKEGPSIFFGNNVFVGTDCEFNIDRKITIGNDCLIASGCRFIDHNHQTTLGTVMNTVPCTGKEIVIGNDVWIGCNSVILNGVVIEDGAIIGAGSIVNKYIPSNEIWAGVPARKIGERKK